MNAIGVIPARWASTRFEGKVLAELNGKPVIQHVWEKASQSANLDEIIIATDDERIQSKAESFGAKTAMTSAEHATGTDRIIEVVEPLDCKIVINIQGDEPMIDPSIIDGLVDALKTEPKCALATVIKVIEHPDDLNNPNVVKVVVDGEMNALYFSRSAIPYDRSQREETIFYKHLGIYGYRKDFLAAFKNLPKSNLEQAEQLEQLRALEYGYKIKTVLTDIETVGVDTPEDLKRAKAMMDRAGAS